MTKGLADSKRRRGKARDAQAAQQLGHLTCSYLHAVQSQRNWGCPAAARNATSSTSPLQGKEEDSAADAAEELQEEGVRDAPPLKVCSALDS